MLRTCSGCYHIMTGHSSGMCAGCRTKDAPLWDKREALEVIPDSVPDDRPRLKNKYTRQVKGADIDIYDVLRAWDVTCPAIQHAVKKLLAPGQRGHKDRITDLREALASVQRGIEMEEGE